MMNKPPFIIEQFKSDLESKRYGVDNLMFVVCAESKHTDGRHGVLFRRQRSTVSVWNCARQYDVQLSGTTIDRSGIARAVLAQSESIECALDHGLGGCLAFSCLDRSSAQVQVHTLFVTGECLRTSAQQLNP